MKLDLTKFEVSGRTVAVALSGGKDSMALLELMKNSQNQFNFTLVAINVEHGIRGESSLADSLFVKNYCNTIGVPLYTYSVDAPEYAKQNNLSLEQSARVLRYQCFYDAISKGNCDVVATAHHKNDNAESVLFNLFRGSGLKGVSGIKPSYDDKIIRPLLDFDRKQIDAFIEQNSLPFVTDETNQLTDYTRNFLRLNVLSEIEKVFPDAIDSIHRFSSIAREEDEFLDGLAKSYIGLDENVASISLDLPDPLMPRAIIIALKTLGLEKDWEKSHVDETCKLKNLSNGAKISLPKNIVAFKEYDKIVIAKKTGDTELSLPFELGKKTFLDSKICVELISANVNLKNGFYLDLDKIPKTAIIRTKQDGDTFTKFGGGTKSLGDYLTDRKIPLRLRDSLPILADGKEVLAIFGVAISDKVKVDGATKNIIKLTREN